MSAMGECCTYQRCDACCTRTRVWLQRAALEGNSVACPHPGSQNSSTKKTERTISTTAGSDSGVHIAWPPSSDTAHALGRTRSLGAWHSRMLRHAPSAVAFPNQRSMCCAKRATVRSGSATPGRHSVGARTGCSMRCSRRDGARERAACSTPTKAYRRTLRDSAIQSTTFGDGPPRAQPSPLAQRASPW